MLQKNTPGDKDWVTEFRRILRINFMKVWMMTCNTLKGALGAFHELRGEVNKLLVKGLSETAYEKKRSRRTF